MAWLPASSTTVAPARCEVVAINPDYRFDDRIASLPFRDPEEIARIAKGLERAGLPTPGCRARHSDAR